ncbi:MAG: hypothetical protein ACK4OP_02135 [Gemmobacter sp.]
MADPNLRDFYDRVARILRAQERGYGFEAAGTLGRSHYPRPRRLRIPVMAPVLVLVCGVLVIKAILHQGLGATDYEGRVAALWDGNAIDRVGAVIMQQDPATVWLSARIGALVR